jgi:hypothetical protein
MTVVVPALSRVVAYRHPRPRVARLAGVDDVAGISILGMSARVKDSLPDWRSALVGRLSYRSACVN